MPPKGPAASRKRENMYFEPGVRGRKTGLTVADSGVRDEHGLEPMDNLFSSPEKAQAPPPPPAAPATLIQAKIATPNLMPPPAKPASMREESRAPAKSARKPVAKPAPAPAPGPRELEEEPQQNGHRKPADETIDDSQSMSIGHSTIPEPTAVLTERRKSQYIPPPKSTSPKKTFLGSPARRHPSLGPPGSIRRGDVIREVEEPVKEKVARKLDFSNDTMRMSPPKQVERPRSTVSRSPVPPATNGKRKIPSQDAEVEDPFVYKARDAERETEKSKERAMPGSWEPEPEPEQEAERQAANRSFDLSPSYVGDEEWRPPNVDDEMDMDEEIERTATPTEPSPPRGPASSKQRMSEKKAIVKANPSMPTQEEKQAEKRKPGRPKKQTIPMAEAAAYQRDTEASFELSDDGPALPPLKRTKHSKSALQPANKSKELNPDPARDSSPVQIQRGPPRPRQNGLFILRRETPGLGGFATTRGGRASVKPVAHWKNEAVVYGEYEDTDDASFLLPTKEVVRRDEVDLDAEPRQKKRGRTFKREEIIEEDDEVEPWEQEPGRIYGAVKEWDSGKEATALDVPEREDEIALSGPAIITRAIPGSEVQFAKTLTLPFFGSGMVDLPSGAVKKPKNSRKMQMVFFVFRGRVKVTVNGTEFRIGEGGVWQVPRGNFYSIENDYEKPARVFFSQGCEVPAAQPPLDE